MIKKIISLAITALLLMSSGNVNELIDKVNKDNGNDKYITVNGKKYTMTFSDDFNDSELDKTKWNYCPEWKRQDLECYWDNDAVSISDGCLKITTKIKDSVCYTGGIRTKDLFEQKYGYFEIRCRLNQISGYWTAFWLMGDSVENVGNSGIDGTEIDIMESAFYGQNKISSALHWDGYGEFHKSDYKETTINGIYEGFHTFALQWTENEYVFFTDGVETWRTKSGGVCQVPLYLKITTETGSWTGFPDEKSLPDSFVVDYVKAYQEL